MSRGLILGGLAGGLANAASNFDNMMLRQFSEDRRDAREEARDMRRIQAAEDREEQLRQRMISEIAAAREGGAQIGFERQAGQVLAASRSMMDSDSPFMETMGDPTELANILRENPQAVEAYRQAGLIQDGMDPRLQTISDQYDAALGAGAHSSVLDALEKQRSATLQQIREERTDRREDERERSNRTMEELRQRQLELSERTQALRDSRQSAQELRTSYNNHLTLIEGQRKSIQDDRRALQAAHQSELASARPSEREAVRARHRQEMARFDPMLRALDSDRNWLRGQLGMPTGSSNSGDNRQTADRPPLDSFMRQQ